MPGRSGFDRIMIQSRFAPRQTSCKRTRAKKRALQKCRASRIGRRQAPAINWVCPRHRGAVSDLGVKNQAVGLALGSQQRQKFFRRELLLDLAGLDVDRLIDEAA